ncbi:zinc-binding dehydrogenase, partial [Actinoplanes sp. NPDC048791]|uniref:zinc-binding dehydrogenase n=1 Tax=Actinoplanes sp. NPDC048791 TaxID=3154623 RepID=UPI0033E17D7B
TTVTPFYDSLMAKLIVLATVSSKEKARLATAAGADAVIDYRREDVVARVRELSGTGPQLVVEVTAS